MKRTFLHLLTGLILVLTLCQCGGINALLKSNDPDRIYKSALDYYNREKWSRASTLFEGVQHYYRNTAREDSIQFYNARCKFKLHDFETASLMLDDFRKSFGRSAFLEDAEGMYAYCFYKMSPGPTRDQTSTSRAIIAINEFISRYPKSDKIDEFQALNEELTGRLHDKSYINAYTYYKIGRYKSAIVALKNALRTYPETKHREEIMFLIVDSNYRLASNSVAAKQTDRYLTMMDSYLSFREEYPESKHTKEVERMAKEAREYLDEHVKENE